MSRENFLLVDTEIQALLDKGVIKMVDLGEDKYLSSIFLAEKERFKPEPSHQCEKHEPACPLRTFQNVGVIFFKRAPEKRGFSMQSGLERCILVVYQRILYISSGKAKYINLFASVSAWLRPL